MREMLWLCAASRRPRGRSSVGGHAAGRLRRRDGPPLAWLTESKLDGEPRSLPVGYLRQSSSSKAKAAATSHLNQVVGTALLDEWDVRGVRGLSQSRSLASAAKPFFNSAPEQWSSHANQPSIRLAWPRDVNRFWSRYEAHPTFHPGRQGCQTPGIVRTLRRKGLFAFHHFYFVTISIRTCMVASTSR
jgi:hypothetical protein